MFNIYDLETARRTILRRVPLSQQSIPDALQQGVEDLFGPGTTPDRAVRQILESVQQDGDQALRHWTRILDHTELDNFAVPPAALEKAYLNLKPALQDALQTSLHRIEDFHRRQPLPDWTTAEMGGLIGQRVTPVRSAGVYVPGGTAPLPSSLLMSVLPARAAGVERVVVATPPDPDPVILGAAYLCGVEEVFQLGGAQAVGALAFGTESITRVDKIVGAGNLFVTLAKQQVFGVVGLDGLAGPTETMVIADASARPDWIAADLLAQAEHDVMASAILVTPVKPLAEAVQAAVSEQIESLSRAEIIAQSLANRGGAVLTPDLETAAGVADEYAAEHLCLAVENPLEFSRTIRNAGGFFLGEYSFEVLGDYVAGPSHVMPTGGTARFASPLNVMDFVKISSLIGLDQDTARQLSPSAALLAREEKLTAHAASADFRRSS